MIVKIDQKIFNFGGENLKLNFDYLKFAKEIIKNSKVELFMINNEKELAK